MSQLTSCMENNISRTGPTIILGDFNCPGVDWQMKQWPTEPCQKLLYDFSVFNGFTQCTPAPTRLNNLLDLVFVNDPLIMSNIEVVSPFSTSDHNAVNIDILYAKTSVTVRPDT